MNGTDIPGTGDLFDVCPLPGCRNPVNDPRAPCRECIDAFGIHLQPPAGEPPSAAEYRQRLAERDHDVARIHAGRREAASLTVAGARSARPKHAGPLGGG
jgi:hypothetical protein